MAFAGDGRRKWSKLPPAILHSICQKVTDIVDYAQFRAVCRSWRSAAKPSDLPPQLPLLLLPRDARRASDFFFFDLSGYDDPLRSLYDLPLGKISTFFLPETLGNGIVCGSSFGWLALLNSADSSLSLFNPFCRVHMALPPLPTSFSPFSSASSFIREKEMIQLKVSLTSSPMDASCEAVAALPLSTQMCLLGAGKEDWEVFDTRPPAGKKKRWKGFGSTQRLPLVCAEYHEGLLVTLDCGGHTVVSFHPPLSSMLKATHIAASVGIGSLQHATHFLVKTDTHLLMVLHFEAEAEIKVFSLDLFGERSKWEPLDSIGDRAMFLSRNGSYVVRAGNFDGCEEDCLYFSELRFSSTKEIKDGVYYIDVYSLKERKFRPLSCRWISNAEGRGDATWLMPALC